MSVILNYTTLGRSIYSVGGNIEVARLSGIAVWRTKTICLMIAAVFAATGGIIYSSLINSGSPTIGRGLGGGEVISAVIIGGISLFGGKGTIWGIYRCAVPCVLLNTMTLWGFNPYAQQIVKGGLILNCLMDTLCHQCILPPGRMNQTVNQFSMLDDMSIRLNALFAVMAKSAPAGCFFGVDY